jgi:uncharacterized membrane protein
LFLRLLPLLLVLGTLAVLLIGGLAIAGLIVWIAVSDPGFVIVAVAFVGPIAALCFTWAKLQDYRWAKARRRFAGLDPESAERAAIAEFNRENWRPATRRAREEAARQRALASVIR